MGLFRQQAVDAYCDRLHGHVVLLPRTPHSLLCLGLLLWLILAVMFLTQANYSRKETVLGWLEPMGGVVRVYPQTEGRLAQLLVQEGERVSRGQPLAVINGDRVLADGQHLESILLEEYAAQKQALQRQLIRADELDASDLQELQQRHDSAQSELDWMARQLDTLQQRRDIVAERLEKHRHLHGQGHITESELELLETQSLELTGELQDMSIKQLRQQALIQQIALEQRQLPAEAANQRDQLKLRLSNLSQEIARLRGTRAYILKAAVDGTVSAIRLKVGQRAEPSQALLSLLPTGSELVAHLLVPVRASGFLRKGQDLSIRYDAFPYQKFGTHAGDVLSVATSASLPSESRSLPFPVTEPVYRVRAQLTSNYITAYGQRFALRPGMTLSADIRLEKRSLVQWLLDPLYSLRGRLT